MQLNYQGTYTFTSEDIDDYNADPPLIFTAYSLRSRQWLNVSAQILDDLDEFTPGLACEMIKAGLLTFSQGENAYSLKTKEDVDTFRQAVGDGFVKHLALGIIVMLRNRDDERKKKSSQSGKASKAGKAIK